MRVTSGHLDMGVFAPWEYMHVDDALGLVEGMRGLLRGLD
jgi:hypothetical protein